MTLTQHREAVLKHLATLDQARRQRLRRTLHTIATLLADVEALEEPSGYDGWLDPRDQWRGGTGDE